MLCFVHTLARQALRQNDNIENCGCCLPAIPLLIQEPSAIPMRSPTKRRMLEIAAERLSQCRMLIHTEGTRQCC
jgi:hypothetical protein